VWLASRHPQGIPDFIAAPEFQADGGFMLKLRFEVKGGLLIPKKWEALKI
jgi:hypothetical protein